MSRIWVTAILAAIAAAYAAADEWRLCSVVLAMAVVFLITTEGRS